MLRHPHSYIRVDSGSRHFVVNGRSQQHELVHPGTIKVLVDRGYIWIPPGASNYRLTPEQQAIVDANLEADEPQQLELW